MNDGELRAMIEQCHLVAYGWSLHCCGGRPEEAEDVLHDAYLRILEGKARFDGRAAFRTWLFAVIRRTAAGERRRQWLRNLGFARYEREKPPTPPAEGPVESIRRAELQSAFRAALARLPLRQREALHLTFYQSLTLSEAAVVMGVSIGSARQHYERGKRRLKKELHLESKGHEL